MNKAPLQQAAAEYIEQLRIERRLAQNTIASYQRDLQDAIRYLQDEHTDWQEVDHTAILAFLDQLKKQGVAQETINRHIVSLRQLYKFLRQTGQVDSDPLAQLTTAAAPAKPTLVLSAAQAASLLSIPNVKNRTGLRDRAIFELLYATGMRVNELLSLKMADVDLNAQLVMPHDRAGRRRVVPISDTCGNWLKRYVSEARLELMRDDTDVFFLNNRGRALTRQAIWQKLRAAVSQAGIDLDVTPDVLRATFAHEMLANGADLRAVRVMLGHQSLNTTERYAPAADVHLAAQYRQYHPRSADKEE